MLAVAWPWAVSDRRPDKRLSEGLASSLCAGIGGHCGSAEIEGLHFAYRPLRSPAQRSAWRPVVLPSGRIVTFHGYFDNARAIAADLCTEAGNITRLYGLAVERWGDEAETKVIGEYCAVI